MRVVDLGDLRERSDWVNHTYNALLKDKKYVAREIRKSDSRLADTGDDYLFECRQSFAKQLEKRRYPDKERAYSLDSPVSSVVIETILKHDLPFSIIEIDKVFYLALHSTENLENYEKGLELIWAHD